MSCAVPGCKSRWDIRYRENNKNINFHRFPIEASQLKKWTEAVSDKCDWTPKKHHRVCSKHFESHCYVYSTDYQTRSLRADAVPTLLLPNMLEMSASSASEPEASARETKTYIKLYPLNISNPEAGPKFSIVSATKAISDPEVLPKFNQTLGTISKTFSVPTQTDSSAFSTAKTMLNSEVVTSNRASSSVEFLRNSRSTQTDTFSEDASMSSSKNYARKLEKRVERLEAIAATRLRKIKALRAQNRRLKESNTVIKQKQKILKENMLFIIE